jgi:hypothetical protein
MTDDQEDTGSMAYMPKTHELLAEKGVTFTNSFVNLPLCAPSRASFLTGQGAHNTGIKANNPSDGGGWGAFKDKEANALPVWLKKAGYKTALIGKYLNRYGQESTFGSLVSWAGSYLNINFTGTRVGNPEDWVPPRWDLWYAFTGSRARYYDYAINENDTIHKFGNEPGRLLARRAQGPRRALYQRAVGGALSLLHADRDQGGPCARQIRHPRARIHGSLQGGWPSGRICPQQAEGEPQSQHGADDPWANQR